MGKPTSSKELLDFVLSLRERVIHQSHANGVTAWALGIAVLYLLLQALPNVAKLKYSLIQLDAFIIFFTHIMGILIAGKWLHLSLIGESKFTKFDYRFLKRYPTRTISIALSFLLVEGVYFFGSMIGILSSYSIEKLKQGLFFNTINIQLSGFEYGIFAFSTFLFGVFLIALIFFSYQSLKDFRENDFYPSIHSLRKKTASTPRFDCIIVFLLFLNALYIFSPTIKVNIDEYKELVLLSFQLGLALFGASYYLKNFTYTNTLDLLDKLERDIVLHNISEEEIKLRLQEEYYGNEFQGWVVEQIVEIKKRSVELNAELDVLESFKGDLNLISKELKFERIGRIESYKKNIESLLGELTTKCNELSKCLGGFAAQVKSDKYLTSVINENSADIKKILSSAEVRATQTIKELEQLLIM